MLWHRGRSARLRNRFLREVAAAQLPLGSSSPTLIQELDLQGMPAAAQRYLRFMGVIGRPRTRSVRSRWTGGFRMRPDQSYIPCEAWQYDSSYEIARIFHMSLRFGGLLPVRVRDTYLHGSGRMCGRILDLFPIVDEQNFKIDIGELSTYLNDAILLAPSMLLGPQTVWSEVSDSSFELALTDQRLVVKARVEVDALGAVTSFSTTDRYAQDPAGPEWLVQTRWSTPIRGWMKAGDRVVPEGGQAVWHFPSGDFTYADFTLMPEDLAFDV